MYFAPWLTTEQAILELAEKTDRDKKKNGEKSVRALEADVASWREGVSMKRLKGMNLMAVRRAAGHRSIRTTARYALVADEALRREMERVTRGR